MKSIILLAIALTTAQVQAAGSLNVDLRADMLSQDYNDAAIAGGSAVDNYRFIIQTGRLDYKGSLNEKTSYRVRARFAQKDQSVIDKRDQTNVTLDHANVTHKFTDIIAFTMGKFAGENGGWEGGTAGPDLYFTSEGYSGGGYLGKLQPTGPANNLTLSGFSALNYMTGAKLSLSFSPEQTLSLMAGDLDKNVGRNAATQGTPFASDVTGQNKSMLAASYQGWFLDKSLGVIASYHTQTLAEDVNSNFIAAGLAYKIGSFAIYGDYILNSYNSIVGAFKPKDTLSSVVVKAVYAIDPTLSAQLKVVSSTESFDTTTVASSSNKYMDYGAALEWKPKADDVFRYHVAYQSRNETPDLSSLDARQLNEVVVGMRIYADLLK